MPSSAGEEKSGMGVLVGMSGGVDSAVAALLLKEQGYRVTGVTLRLWNDPASAGERSCCSDEAVHRAQEVAHHLGIPHYVVDASGIFAERVVQYFIQEYAAGRTPNPCAKCNARVRFGLMRDIARQLGLTCVATGHYARLAGEPAGLARGADRSKDQSYVLAEVEPELLREVVFPLGGLRKVEVRALAVKAGLPCHSARESQEICFIPDDDHRRFLRERLGERHGAIVDTSGREVARHTGTYNFTVGQRKGLRITRGEPTYVVALEANEQKVVVGEARDILTGAVQIEGVVRHRPELGSHPTVQLRSLGDAVPAQLIDAGTIVLKEPAMGVAPGQTAVMYDGEMVTVAGTITSTERWAGSRA